MKKIFIALMFVGITAFNAQTQTYFAGGTISFDYNGDKSSLGSTTNKGPASFSFELSPMLGYYLSDNLGAGVKISVGMSVTNDRAEQEPTKDKSFDWGFGPFLRYTVLTRGDFSILMEGGVGIFGGSSKTTYGTTTNDGPKHFGFDIGVMPILSYSLTNRVNIEASTNLARFGFTTQTEKRGSGDSQRKDTESSFGFGVDTYDFFKSPYQLGVIFKF